MTKHSKKQNKNSVLKTRLVLRYDHPFTTGRRIAIKVIVISVSFFFLLLQEERFAFSRDTRDDAVFTSLAGKIPQVNFIVSLFFVSIYIFNQCSVKFYKRNLLSP